jgi:hypothetical protein
MFNLCAMNSTGCSGAKAPTQPSTMRQPASPRPEGSPHSAWEVLEHLRIAQWDMLEFSRDTKHKSPAWPEEYWPKNPEPLSAAAWDESIQHFHRDLAAMRSLVANPESDLFTPFAHGDGQTLLREALQLADHNAYHTGELIFLRRQLGALT